jgi:hypothetical protein
MWILIIEIPLTVSEIPLTVSGIPLTHNPKETRVAYAVQYDEFFLSEISLTVSGIPLSKRIPCRLVWFNGSSYKYRNTRYWKPVYVEITPVTELNG